MTAVEQSASPVDRVLTALSAAGCNPRGSGPGQWSARCPVTAAHKGGDRNPSLSVGGSPTGAALVYCHRGCTVTDIADALGFRLTDLFPDAPPNVTHVAGGQRVKAIYRYYDAAGALAYEVVRMDPKGFRQRRWVDGLAVWNLTGVERVPYCLPQVIAAVATRRPVWIVEGEKDAENVARIDPRAVGTCNSGGAGRWDDRHARWLHGAAEVVVVADDDEPGIAHARTVVRTLRGRVANLRVVKAAEGCKDLTDHLRAGYGAAELRTVWVDGGTDDWSEQGPVDDTPEPNPLLAMLIDWQAFWAQDHADEQWLAWPLLPAGRQVALYAPAKIGKSLIMLDLCAALASGRSILGGKPGPPRHVLYVDYEMTQGDLLERLSDLGYGPDDDTLHAHLHYASLPSLPPLDQPEGAKVLVELATLVEAELVVIDTFGRAVQGDENENDTVRNFYRWTGLALKAAGIALWRSDHAGKDLAKGQRGGSAKNDDVDVVWQLTPAEGGVTLKATHRRIAWVPETVEIIRQADPLRHVVAQGRGYAAGTKECADALDALGLPIDVGRPTAAKELREAGRKFANRTISDALRWRREAVDNPVREASETPEKLSPSVGDSAKSDERETVTGTQGTVPQNPRSQHGDSDGDSAGQASESNCPLSRISRYGQGQDCPPDFDPDAPF